MTTAVDTAEQICGQGRSVLHVGKEPAGDLRFKSRIGVLLGALRRAIGVFG